MKNLLVVDVQKGYVTEENKSVIKKIKRYIKTNEFDNIIYTKFIEGNFCIDFGGVHGLDGECSNLAIRRINGGTLLTRRSLMLSENVINKIKSISANAELQVVGIQNLGNINKIKERLKTSNVFVNILKDLIYNTKEEISCFAY